MLIRFRQKSAPVVLVAFTTFLATTVLPPRVARAQSEPVPTEAPSEETGTFEALKEEARDPDALRKNGELVPWREELQAAEDGVLADKAEANTTVRAQADSTMQAAADKGVASDSPADVQAQALPTADRTGVTGKTISIPKGEGTIQGMEESFSAQLSTGIATFSVPFALPSARGGAQPSLGLSYSSSSGHGLAGVGWDLGVPFIARQTDRGVPKYDDKAQWHPEQDRFVFNGGQELVPICVVGAALECPGKINRDATDEALPAWSAGYQYFRARVEGSFLRFFWHSNHKTWRVQDKSGVTMELGVPLDGSNDESALEKNPDAPPNRPEIYRWLLVRQYDAYGNSQVAQPAPVNLVRYRYFQDGGQAYLSDIYDTPPGPATSAPTAPVSQYAHHTRIVYEDRTDPTFSFRSGWPIEQNLRVARVDVASKSFAGSATSARELVRRYHLDYDPAFHASYLAAVEVEGRCADTAGTQIAENNSEALPELTGCPTLPPMRFSYTHVEGSSGGAVASASIPGYEAIDEEVVALSDSPDYSLDEQQTTLYDINADGLSDVLVTAAGFFGGKHGVFFNKAARFTASTIGVRGVLGADSGTIALSNLNVVPLDLDGDATSDLLHMPLVKTYSIYTPKKESTGWWWVGRTIDNADDLNPKIDFGRDTTDIKVVDVNFDGLVDVIRSTGTEFQTFLSLGRYPSGDGQFGDATRTSATTANISTDPIRSCVPWRGTPVRLSDPDTFLGEMNGDGIADIVRVRRGDIRYWPGRGTGVWGIGSRSVADCPEGTFAQGRDLPMDKSPYYSDIQGDSIRLDDVNGDGLDDLVQVNYDSVYIWLNVDGVEWTGQHQIPGTPYSPSFANRVRLTDINGSGTADILWGDATRYKYIDLSGGTRPGLLSRVENGLGKSTDIEYTTSTAEMLAAEAANSAWTSVMPTVVHMVKRVTVSDNLTIAGRPPTQDVTEYTYRDPVYEGRQREFRGFRHAAARRAGDANSPADVTETTFLLGECYDETNNGVDDCSLGERWRDNPAEALKGLPVVTEKRNDASIYLSTSRTTYRLRELYQGLDGRTVRHAFESATETFLYDTAGFATSASTTPKQVVEVSLRPDNTTFSHTAEVLWAPATPIASHSTSVTQRASAGSGTLRTSNQVDYFGNRVQASNTGCAEGPACDGLGLAQETLTEVTTPGRPTNEPSRWLWRTAQSLIQGNQHVFFLPQAFKNTVFGYNAQGTLLSAVHGVNGTVALDREVSDANNHPSRLADLPGALTGGVIVGVAGGFADAFGNITRETGANNRCRDITYDSVYQHLPVTEAAHINGCFSGTLNTSAIYDRGLELATQIVNVQEQPTDVRYDGFGRLIKLWKPHPITVGGVSLLPSVEVEYFLPPTRGTAHSVIHTKSQDGATDATNAYLESWSYVDGLGRAIASVSEAEAATPEARYIVSELTDVDNKGGVRRKYLDHFTFSAPDQLPLAAEPAAPYGSQRYDAFGRQAQTFDLDGTVTLKTVYHALSKDMWDAADLEATPHQGTFYSERTDGHGRVVETTERFKVETVVQKRITKIQYTPLGAPEVIRRIQASTGQEITRYIAYDNQGRMVLNVEPNVSPNYTLVSQPNRQLGGRDVTFASVKGWRYAYNVAGDLVGVSDSRGCGANYFYDGLGRLSIEDYFPCEPHHAPYEPPNIFTLAGLEAVYLYDDPVDPGFRDSDVHQQLSFLYGQLTAKLDRGGLRVFDFDGRGRMTKENAQIITPPPTSENVTPRRYRRDYQYDAADRPVHETTGATVTELQGTSAGGSTSAVQTTYNARGAVQSVGGSYGTLVSRVDRNADDLVSLIRYGDVGGTESTFHYDDRRRLRSAQTYRSAASVWPGGWDTKQVVDGVGVAEAEDFTHLAVDTTPPINYWMEQTSPASGTFSGASGGKFMRTLPDSGNVNGFIEPFMLYKFYIPAGGSGSYIAYSRQQAGNTASMGSWITIADANGNHLATPTGWVDPSGFWQWQTSPTVTLTAGNTYFVKIMMIEDGSGVDKVVLQLASLPAPTDLGPPSTSAPAPETFQLLLQDDEYTYDVVNNPTEIHDYRIPEEWPAGAQPTTRRIDYDDLYRVTRVYYEHHTAADTWVSPFADEVSAYSENPTDPQSAIDRRRALPSPHTDFDERSQWEMIRYDWRGNTDRNTDSERGFYDRETGQIVDGSLTDGPYQIARATVPTQFTHSGELTTEYDEAGNLIRLNVDRDGPCLPTPPAVAGCSHVFLYEWDEIGRMSAARRYDFSDLDADAPPNLTGLTAAVELRYRYDASDQRVIKTAVDPDTGDERHTLYVFPTLELRRARYGTAYGTGGASDYELAKDTEVPYLLANGVRLGRVVYDEGLSVSVPGNQRVFLEMGDHLGSTSIVVDKASSEVVERTTYYALGKVDSDYRPERWKSFREDYRFTGKEEDVEVGLTYFGKRYLNPYLGRWVSADPLGVHSPGEADLNLYAYVRGMALKAIDPMGLQEVTDALDTGLPPPVDESGQSLVPTGEVFIGPVTVSKAEPEPSPISTDAPGVPNAESAQGVPQGAYNRAVETTEALAQTPYWMQPWLDVRLDLSSIKADISEGEAGGAFVGGFIFDAASMSGAGQTLVGSLGRLGAGRLELRADLVIDVVSTSPRITSGSQVTEQIVRDAMRDAPLISQQSGGVSLPKIQDFVDKLLAGEVAPSIKVDNSMIVDGNHRYIAGRILGQEPAIQPWAGGRPANAVPWETIPINPEAW